jgi:tetratricopeptide (TPR) repeat protein
MIRYLVSTIFLLVFCFDIHAARLALVIGNSNYLEGPLKNPINDARSIYIKLNELGFNVTLVENLRKENIGKTISTFASKVKLGDELVFFYAGHGLQLRGVNYLTAVNAEIKTEEDAPLNSIDLDKLVHRLNETPASIKLFFIDACRNNPYSRSFRSSDTGLSRMIDVPTGTLMHFATRPGGVADDGTGANSLYTMSLLKHIDTSNIPVESILKRVSTSVNIKSKGKQVPWTEGNILGEFFFKTQPVSPTYPNTQSTSTQASNTNTQPPTLQSSPPSSLIEIPKVSVYDANLAKNWADRSFDSVNSANWIEAIRTASVALSYDPGNIQALINKCVAYINRQDYQEATANCLQALRLEPSNSIARNNIGLIHARSGDIESALLNYQASCIAGFPLACENFKKIKGYAPNDHETIKRVWNSDAAKFLNEGRNDEAIAACNKILKDYPTNATALATRSAAFANKGLYKEAIEDANKALRIDPDLAVAYNNRGYAQALAGNPKLASLDYEIACSMKFDLGCKNLKLAKTN